MIESGNPFGWVRNQFAYFAHHIKSQKTCSKAIDILKKYDSMLELVLIGGNKSILNYI